MWKGKEICWGAITNSCWVSMVRRAKAGGLGMALAFPSTFIPMTLFPYINMHPAYSDPDKTCQRGFFGFVARLNLANSLKLTLGARVSWYAFIPAIRTSSSRKPRKTVPEVC
jgi:hypothetical protein